MRAFLLAGLLGLLFFGMIIGCRKRLPPLPAELVEVQRISSANGKVDAVLFTSDAGATTSTGTHLFLVPHGQKVQSLKYAVLSMDYVDGLAMQWVSEKEFNVSYSKARIFHYTNFWQHQFVDDYKFIVEITLSPRGSAILPRQKIEF